MESSQAAFEELERALGSAQFTFDHHPYTTGGAGEITSAGTPLVSMNFAGFPDSDDESRPAIQSPEIETASPRKDEARHTYLPPTPPTPEKTRVSESRHAPLSTGLTQGDLRSQPSGLSSQGVDWRSLPTPDPSPPRTRENLLLPFYLLDHSSSSYTDSFRTAREGQSRAESPTSSRLLSPGSVHTPLTISKRLNSIDQMSSEQMDTPSRVWQEDSNPAGYAVGVDGGTGQRRRSILDAVANSDSTPASPTLVRSLSQGTAQRRLWSVIQPGDAVKRPDQSLLYTNHNNPVLRKRPIFQSKEVTQVESDARADGSGQETDIQPMLDEIQDEVRLGNDADAASDKLDAPPEMDEIESSAQAAVGLIEADQDRSDQLERDEIHDVADARSQHGEGQHDNISRPVGMETPESPPETRNPAIDRPRGDADGLSRRPRTPHSVTKSSLEDNNVVYKLIREENVKRHSNISDGSVQAVVFALPENKRTLRHTPKRHSLRGDASLTSNSQRSSAESGRKSIKRNTGTTFTNSDTDLTSPDASPSIAKATVKTTPAIQLPSSISSEGQVQPGGRRSPRDASSGANTVILARRSSSPQSSRVHSLRRSNREHGIELVDGSRVDEIARGSPGDDAVVYDVAVDDASDDVRVDALENTAGPVDPDDTRRAASPPMHQAAHMSSRPVYVPLATLYSPPRLRRFSNESRLERNVHVRRTSLGKSARRSSQPLEIKLEQAAKELTREGHELLDDNRHSLALTSTLTTPKRGSFDVHLRHPTHASFSVSQASMPTDVELLEARGVALYPHHNESLLVVQQGPRTTGGRGDLDRPSMIGADEEAQESPLGFTTDMRPRAMSINSIGRPIHAVDSPLTNPRAPPEPPTIKFIPPTPSEELEKELIVTHDRPLAASALPSRRPSLSQRVRRYSEGLIQPLGIGRLGGVRRQPQPEQAMSLPRHQRALTFSNERRPTHLSSFWHPRGFWEDVDSEDEEDDWDDGPAIPSAAPLPPGGDTSHHPGRTASSARASSLRFPRNMSVRMPGFRGTGGFLQGNSLGIDRHGTNNRRPYVRWPSSEEQRRRRIAERRRARVWSRQRDLPHAQDRQQQQQQQPRKRGTSARGGPPRTPNNDDPRPNSQPRLQRIEYTGLRFIRTHFRALRSRRADAALEKRREALRSSIGTKVYLDGRVGLW